MPIENGSYMKLTWPKKKMNIWQNNAVFVEDKVTS